MRISRNVLVVARTRGLMCTLFCLLCPLHYLAYACSCLKFTCTHVHTFVHVKRRIYSCWRYTSTVWGGGGGGILAFEDMPVICGKELLWIIL